METGDEGGRVIHVGNEEGEMTLWIFEKVLGKHFISLLKNIYVIYMCVHIHIYVSGFKYAFTTSSEDNFKRGSLKKRPSRTSDAQDSFGHIQVCGLKNKTKP